ncbi:MAG TPA: low affinity iron permease family protein [Candidatus Binatia bacterium]|nr:low affinity iron permease family protein [Candidatus Binatia bacterium]
MYRNWFEKVSRALALRMGRASTFVIAVSLIVVWGASGPIFDYSDTWQLVINTTTTIVTFLMVFLIQNTQNRDTMALQLKLDELIRCTKGAHNALLSLEEIDEEHLQAFQLKYRELAERARKAIHDGLKDTGTVDFSYDGVLEEERAK